MRKFYAFILLIVLTIGNVNLVSAKHFCNGDIAKESIIPFQNLHNFGCGMEINEKTKPNCSKQKHTTKSKLSQTPCCKNEITEFQSELLNKQKQLEIATPKQHQKIYKKLDLTPLTPNPIYENNNILFKYLYKHKLYLLTNYLSLFQTYLI